MGAIHTTAETQKHPEPKPGIYKRFKEGLHKLTPLQLIQAKINGYIGTCFGIIFASYFLVQKGLWYFTPILAFSLILQIISLISTLQQKKQMLNAEELMSTQQSNLKKILEEMEDEPNVNNTRANVQN